MPTPTQHGEKNGFKLSQVQNSIKGHRPA